jgi:hypothetical protein
MDISLLAGSIAGATGASITTRLLMLVTSSHTVFKGSTTSSTVDSIHSNNTRLTKRTTNIASMTSSNITKVLSLDSIRSIGTTSLNL